MLTMLAEKQDVAIYVPYCELPEWAFRQWDYDLDLAFQVLVELFDIFYLYVDVKRTSDPHAVHLGDDLAKAFPRLKHEVVTHAPELNPLRIVGRIDRIQLELQDASVEFDGPRNILRYKFCRQAFRFHLFSLDLDPLYTNGLWGASNGLRFRRLAGCT